VRGPVVEMEDVDVMAALAVPERHPVFRAVMEIVRRNVECAKMEVCAERHVARNPMKTTYYAACFGSYDSLAAQLEDTRAAALAGRSGVPGEAKN